MIRHNSMNEFIDNMGQSIFAYSQKKGYSASPEYCQKLAWSTMYGTDLFEQILTNQQQQEYGNIGAREQDNQNYQEEDPKGEDRNEACN